jgi:hypothetical protein
VNLERRAIRNDERELLVRFAHLDITLDELLHQLDGMVELTFGSTERRFTAHWLLVEPGIKVESAEIERAVINVRDGLLSEQDLVRWATMLLLNDAYVWGSEDDGDEEISDALNDLSIGGLGLYSRNRSQ